MKERLERRAGFTLVELIVVVAILAVLAALVLSRFDTLLKDAGHAAGAASMADAGNAIETWYTATRGFYPDGWDTRMSSSGALLGASTGATPVSGSTTVLPPELVGSTGRLATYTLTAGDVLGFNNVGITTLFNMDATPLSETSRPNDWFNTSVTLSTGSTVAMINQAGGNANKIIDHIFSQNLLNGGANTGVLPANTTLVAFGLGAHNTLVTGASSATGANNALGNANVKNAFMREAPVDGSFNSALMYNRLIVVFAVTESSTTGNASTVTFAGVFGADGDLITDDAAALNGSAP